MRVLRKRERKKKCGKGDGGKSEVSTGSSCGSLLGHSSSRYRLPGGGRKEG